MTPEVICWQLYFSEIPARNQQNSHYQLSKGETKLEDPFSFAASMMAFLPLGAILVSFKGGEM